MKFGNGIFVKLIEPRNVLRHKMRRYFARIFFQPQLLFLLFLYQYHFLCNQPTQRQGKQSKDKLDSLYHFYFIFFGLVSSKFNRMETL